LLDRQTGVIKKSRGLPVLLCVAAIPFLSIVGGETRIDNINQNIRANTLLVGAGMGLRIWQGADLVLNYESVVAKPSGGPDAQTVRLTIRQLW
jgi:hypothetical protein